MQNLPGLENIYHVLSIIKNPTAYDWNQEIDWKYLTNSDTRHTKNIRDALRHKGGKAEMQQYDIATKVLMDRAAEQMLEEFLGLQATDIEIIDELPLDWSGCMRCRRARFFRRPIFTCCPLSR